MLTLSPEQKRFVRVQTIGTMVVNGLSAALFALLLVHGNGESLWGNMGLMSDIWATTFLTGWLMGIIMSAVIRRYVRSGKVEVTPWDWSKHAILRFLPRARGRRNLLIGFAAAIIFSPPLMALVYLLSIDPWSLSMVLIAKVIYGMLLGVVLGPIIATAAIVGNGELQFDDPRGAPGLAADEDVSK
jgi:hypothetical protein